MTFDHDSWTREAHIFISLADELAALRHARERHVARIADPSQWRPSHDHDAVERIDELIVEAEAHLASVAR